MIAEANSINLCPVCAGRTVQGDPDKAVAEGRFRFAPCHNCKESGEAPVLDERTMRLYWAMTNILNLRETDFLGHSLALLASVLARMGQQHLKTLNQYGKELQNVLRDIEQSRASGHYGGQPPCPDPWPNEASPDTEEVQEQPGG